MIRFIDLEDQILEDCPMFTWYDTITDTFEEYNGNQTWETWKDFVYDHTTEKQYKTKPIERYFRLFPKKSEEVIK